MAIVGIFGSRRPKIRFGKFSENYFHENIDKYLWKNEEVLESGFFTSVEDDFTMEAVQLLGGNEYTYLALTKWRLFESHLANGNFISLPYEKLKFKLGKNNGSFFISYISEIKEIITYQIDENFYKKADKLLRNKIPKPVESTTFSFDKESVPPMFFCDKCKGKNLTNGVKDKPKSCRSCYRKNKK